MSSPLNDYITTPLVEISREAQEAAWALAVCNAQYRSCVTAKPETHETRRAMIESGERVLGLQARLGLRVVDPDNVRALVLIAQAELADPPPPEPAQEPTPSQRRAIRELAFAYMAYLSSIDAEDAEGVIRYGERLIAAEKATGVEMRGEAAIRAKMAAAKEGDL